MRDIVQNYKNTLINIEKTALAAGRDASEVTLIAVSKTKPIEDLRAAYNAGARVFGENKVQELMEKIPQMPYDVRWHMIGHLQKNKVKYLIGKCELIHSVDSLSLAETINNYSVKSNVITDILIEVNIADEDTKFGVSPNEIIELLRKIALLPGVRVRGLMTVAPICDNPEDNAAYFHALKQLSVDINLQKIDNIFMEFLSMGMTDDYSVAVREGATFVRVGTGIFGERNYSI